MRNNNYSPKAENATAQVLKRWNASKHLTVFASWSYIVWWLHQSTSIDRKSLGKTRKKLKLPLNNVYKVYCADANSILRVILPKGFLAIVMDGYNRVTNAERFVVVVNSDFTVLSFCLIYSGYLTIMLRSFGKVAPWHKSLSLSGQHL